MVFWADEVLAWAIWIWKLDTLIAIFKLSAEKPASKFLPHQGVGKCCCHRGGQSPCAAQHRLPTVLVTAEEIINTLFVSQILFLNLHSNVFPEELLLTLMLCGKSAGQ